jgi:hypothetical protein
MFKTVVNLLVTTHNVYILNGTKIKRDIPLELILAVGINTLNSDEFIIHVK